MEFISALYICHYGLKRCLLIVKEPELVLNRFKLADSKNSYQLLQSLTSCYRQRVWCIFLQTVNWVLATEVCDLLSEEELIQFSRNDPLFGNCRDLIIGGTT